jgi:hypothetical protein
MMQTGGEMRVLTLACFGCDPRLYDSVGTASCGGDERLARGSRLVLSWGRPGGSDPVYSGQCGSHAGSLRHAVEPDRDPTRQPRFDGKEGVDGSSPSEGFRAFPGKGGFGHRSSTRSSALTELSRNISLRRRRSARRGPSSADR